MVYTITFNPALDYVMKVDEITTKDINRTTDEQIYCGGKGINVSVILAELGIENTALGFIAGFTGDKLQSMLKSQNIVTDFTKLSSGNTRINVKIKAQKEIDVNAQGPNITKEDINVLMSKLQNIKSNDYLVLAGSIPKTLPEDIYQNIIKQLQNKNINFVVDATGSLLVNVLKYKPFLVKPNHIELGEIFGVTINTTEEVITYAKKLQQMGAKNVLVSRAKDGATLITENNEVFSIDNIEGKLVNSVGCGDSMVAGFVAGYIQKQDYNFALKLGASCGNATAFSECLATKKEINDILKLYE